MANYSLKPETIPLGNNQTFKNSNFTQLLPHTKILEGYTGIKFINCNLANCDVPPDAVLEGCKPYHISFCSHLHPEWVPKGLPECAEDCSHFVSTDTITIDGVVVDSINYYEDKESV